MVRNAWRALDEPRARRWLAAAYTRWRDGYGSHRGARKPTAAEVAAELEAVVKAYGANGAVEGQVDRDHHRAHVRFTTTKVVLNYEDHDGKPATIDLGRFQVTVGVYTDSADYLQPSLSADALEPNPYVNDGSFTHPHVANAKPCMGQGEHMLHAALIEGRFSDAADVVDRVLHNYEADSAHVPLADWLVEDETYECANCGETWDDEDDIHTCPKCDEAVCSDCDVGSCKNCDDLFHRGDCIDSCERCDEFVCAECAARNVDGGGHYCTGCVRACDACDKKLRRDDLDGGLCQTCRDERARLEAEEEERARAAAEAALAALEGQTVTTTTSAVTVDFADLVMNVESGRVGGRRRRPAAGRPPIPDIPPIGLDNRGRPCKSCARRFLLAHLVDDTCNSCRGRAELEAIYAENG